MFRFVTSNTVIADNRNFPTNMIQASPSNGICKLCIHHGFALYRYLNYRNRNISTCIEFIMYRCRYMVWVSVIWNGEISISWRYWVKIYLHMVTDEDLYCTREMCTQKLRLTHENRGQWQKASWFHHSTGHPKQWQIHYENIYKIFAQQIFILIGLWRGHKKWKKRTFGFSTNSSYLIIRFYFSYFVLHLISIILFLKLL